MITLGPLSLSYPPPRPDCPSPLPSISPLPRLSTIPVPLSLLSPYPSPPFITSHFSLSPLLLVYFSASGYSTLRESRSAINLFNQSKRRNRMKDLSSVMMWSSLHCEPHRNVFMYACMYVSIILRQGTRLEGQEEIKDT